MTTSQVPLSVGANDYELVHSYFAGRVSSEKIAKTFTENLFKISAQSGIDVMTLLETFDSGDSKLTISLTMAYYLNNFSDKTVLYGINNIITPDQNVQRNIIQ
jgi:hypothetical protein